MPEPLTIEPTVARLEVGDVEELQFSVAPWQLSMNQLSKGSLQASFDVVRAKNILLTREQWSKRVSAKGLSPAGFLALSANFNGPEVSWCGSELSSERILYAYDAQEIDFVALEDGDRWVMLLPMTLIENHIGRELRSVLPMDNKFIVTNPKHIQHLTSQVGITMAALQACDGRPNDPALLDALETQLLNAATRIILNNKAETTDSHCATKRFLAFRDAQNLIESTKGVYSIDDLAKSTGVSRRSLEVGFGEGIKLSPLVFARHVRLNRVHRELLYGRNGIINVTDTLQKNGFTELGRAAGYYKALFNESPCDTLRREPAGTNMRLQDAL
ncbi:MAG: helix-turn-helix domain-containing protein [Halioglobus sp.]